MCRLSRVQLPDGGIVAYNRDVKTRPLFLAPLTTLYLLIPVPIFAFGWLRPLFAWPTVAVAVLGMGAAARALVLAGREASWGAIKRNLSWLWPALLLVSAWVAFSGIGGLGLQNGDYRMHNALLKALILDPWPLRITFDGQVVSIVYYLGYYLPAAAFGKLFGWRAANAFIFAWALAGVWLSFLWFGRMVGNPGHGRRSWRLVAVALVFCLASGMDVMGYYCYQANPFEWGKHLEHWADVIQYTSQSALLYWVPQHTLAAWLVAGLTFACLDDVRTFRYLGLAIAASVLWSPFGMVGIAPYLLGLLIVFLRRKQIRALLEPLSLCLNAASLWLAAVHLLYISSNQYEFPSGLLWNLVRDRGEYASTLGVFWLLEFALLAGAVAWLARALGRNGAGVAKARWGVFAWACLVLTGLPLFKMGYSNDLVMRGSIPSLLVLWAFAARVLLDAVQRLKQWRVALPFALLVLLLLVGSYTSLSEIGRSISRARFEPPALDTVKPVAEATYPHIVAQRIGRDDTLFYRFLGR